MKIKPLRCLLLVLGISLSAMAEQPDALTANTAKENIGMEEVIELLRQQQQELTAQRKLLESQSRKIESLTRELDTLRTPALEDREGLLVNTQPDFADEKEDTPTPTTRQTPPETDEEEAAAAGESVAQAQADDPTLALLEDFEGAWRLPGTNAALSIGGHVKTSIVYNFDPLEIKDRFIVGAIPVGEEASTRTQAQSSITASQSRLNFDLREPTDYGLFRAFIEGDFAGEEDTFRLRHAFGQWNKVLAGKTWSAFVDTQATPEEVDFEGLNGRINVRQSQVRIMPQLGERYQFQVSLEDPNPEVQNGSGVTRTPDMVFTGRFNLKERLHLKQRLHLKASLLGRQIRAQHLSSEFSGVEKEIAWGLSLSGRINTPRFDERDNFLFQLNTGNGIGRYVNDLSSIGDFDGILNPVTGELELFDINAGYVSWQHWWKTGQFRSNFTFGVVDVDNPSFVDADAYKRTLRLSSNLMWSPTSRVDLGGEYMWGRRENQDGENNEATQVQMSMRYRF